MLSVPLAAAIDVFAISWFILHLCLGIAISVACVNKVDKAQAKLIAHTLTSIAKINQPFEDAPLSTLRSLFGTYGAHLLTLLLIASYQRTTSKTVLTKLARSLFTKFTEKRDQLYNPHGLPQLPPGNVNYCVNEVNKDKARGGLIRMTTDCKGAKEKLLLTPHVLTCFACFVWVATSATLHARRVTTTSCGACVVAISTADCY